jgi:hypothetical protein
MGISCAPFHVDWFLTGDHGYVPVFVVIMPYARPL